MLTQTTIAIASINMLNCSNSSKETHFGVACQKFRGFLGVRIRLDVDVYSDSLSRVVFKGARIVLDESSLWYDDVDRHVLTCCYKKHYLEVSSF